MNALNITESIAKSLEFKITSPTLLSQSNLCAFGRKFLYETPTSYIFYVSGSQTGLENLADTPNVSGVLQKFKRKEL